MSASALGLLVAALATLHGLQLLRGALASLSVYLGQVRDVDPVVLAGAIFLIFLLGFAAPLIRRALGAQRGLLVLAAALALLRLAEQCSSAPDARLAAQSAGLVVWLWLLPLVIVTSYSRASEAPGMRPFIGILLGLTIDSAVKGAFGTLDPGFSGSLAALLTTVCSSGAQLILVLWLWRSRADQSDQSAHDDPPVSAFCLGPALALQALIFQNLAHHAVLIGWNLPATSAWLLLANTGALWVALHLSRTGFARARWALLVAAVILMASAVPAPNPWTAALIAIAAPTSVAVLLAGALAPARNNARGWFAISLGLLGMPLVLLGWYSHYETGFPIPQPLIPLLAAGLVVLSVCPRLFWHSTSAEPTDDTGSAVSSIRHRPGMAGLIAIPALLMLLPLYQHLSWNSPRPATSNEASFRVATYNIHQGFDLHGRPSLEQIADILDEHQPDVVALQEVPRGWVVNGSVDALSWLAQRLEMHAAWGPAADDFWGNAVLSRYPIVAFENRPMPNNSAIRFDRAFLLVTLDVRGRQIQVLATHLHHVESQWRQRLPQVQALLDGVDWSRPTILLGDLNAQPHHREIRLLTEAGLSAGHPVIPTYPANRPSRQIDYVLTTEAFTTVKSYTVQTKASDHLPLFVELDGGGP